MAKNDDHATETVSTKLTPTTARELDAIALKHGVSRSRLLRELVLAAVDERVIFRGPLGRNDRRYDPSRAQEDARAALRIARSDVTAASVDVGAAGNVVELARDAAETVVFEG